MTRPAWNHRGQWECSHCGRRLGAATIDGATWFNQGWGDESGRLVWHRAHQSGMVRSIRQPDGTHIRQQRERGAVPTHKVSTPVVVVCRNRDCGEEVLVG